MGTATHFLDELVQWAQNQSDVRAVALVGSYARNAAMPLDEGTRRVVAEGHAGLVRT